MIYVIAVWLDDRPPQPYAVACISLEVEEQTDEDAVHPKALYKVSLLARFFNRSNLFFLRKLFKNRKYVLVKINKELVV